MNNIGGEKIELWDKEDGFFYDVLHLPDGRDFPIKVRSMVGLIPLFAVETLDPDSSISSPVQTPHAVVHRKSARTSARMSKPQTTDGGSRRFLSLVNRDRLKSRAALHAGRRRISFALRHPRPLALPQIIPMFFRERHGLSVDYEPAESSTGLFGGNSNWRGPIWFPVNYLLIESLQKFHYFLGDKYKVECPTGPAMLELGKSPRNFASAHADLSAR